MRLIHRSVLLIICLFFLISIASFDSAVYAKESQAQSETEELFDFGTVDTGKLQSAEKPPLPVRPIFFILPALFFAVVFLIILVIWIRAGDIPMWRRFSLGGLPDSFKLLITLCLSVYGLVHIVALINVYVQTRVVYPGTAEYFFYMPIQKLTGASHAHLFGHSTMYALTAVAFMFTGVSEKIKIPVVAAAFLGAPIDIYSWWLTKYLGADYEIISVISGGAISLAFLIMYSFIFIELWFKLKTTDIKEVNQ